MTTLHLARYRFSFRITEPMRLPAYAGSALRGAFGHALMQLSGINKADIAEQTPTFLQSVYAQVFDSNARGQNQTTIKGVRQLPVPYVIEAPLTPAKAWQPGEVVSFHLVLCEPALSQFAMIVLAWQRAFLQGIGSGDGKGELMRVEYESAADQWQEIYSDTQPLLRAHNTQFQLAEFKQPQDVQLHLQTPLRIQQRGKILGPQNLDASTFLRNLIRRVTVQVQQQNLDIWPLERIQQLNQLADQVQGKHELTWQNWERYSSRQKQTMKLGGAVGHWDLKAVPTELLTFIHIGQWLHLGKETAFGLGKYQWLNLSR